MLVTLQSRFSRGQPHVCAQSPLSHPHFPIFSHAIFPTTSMPSFSCARSACAGWTFTSERALNEHWEESPDHPYCKMCCLRLSTEAKLDYHNHSQHPYCAEDDRHFGSKEAFVQHCKAKHSARFCVDCEALFESEADRREVSAFPSRSFGKQY